jgi:hypothetical protein
VRPGFLGLLLAILATYSGSITLWKKADLHHDGDSTEYGHCTVKQTYKNVLNNVVKLTNGLCVIVAIPCIPSKLWRILAGVMVGALTITRG